MTNADRIRAMTDEELAEWFGVEIDCGGCERMTKGCGKPCTTGCGKPCTTYANCIKHWFNWLTGGRTMTNADRIRAMTDEELAMIVCCQDYKTGDGCFDASCYECTLEWLKQEVTE